MKSKFSQIYPIRRFERGFALIVTLSLMILITVIAVGMLTLASISLRAGSNGAALSEARANARLALLMAIGELQSNAGPDTRVTARADVVKKGNPPVLGVWKSWEGTDHDRDAKPIAPDYSDHKKARFLAWLTSSSREDGIEKVPDTTKGAILVGEGSVGKIKAAERQIRLAPLTISTRGGFAWWVGGENQKARLPQTYEPQNGSPAGWADLAASHSVVDPAPFGLNQLLGDPDSAALAISLKQSDLLKPSADISQEFFHDLSVTSTGLLTNTATGGWRKDFSLAADSWSSQSTRDLPLFRAQPDKDVLYARPTNGSPLPKISLLYPWADYRGSSGDIPIYNFPAIGSWEQMMDYANLYKSFSATSGLISIAPRGTKIDGDRYDFIHKVRILPVIARIQWILSHKVKPSTTRGKYDLYAVVQPIFTLWNPYNVRLSSVPALSFNVARPLPPVISYKVGGVAVPTPYSFGGANYSLPSIPEFGPGETRIFSTTGNSTQLTVGYKPGLGQEIKVATAVGSGTGDDKISTDISFDREYDDNSTGVGIYLDMVSSAYGGRVLAYRMTYSKAVANASYPAKDASNFPQPSLAEAAAATPFLSVTFGARMASNTYLPSKGFVQQSPFVNYTAMGGKAVVERTIGYQYPGTLHNVNSPFEYSFQGLTANSQYLPDSDSRNRGFIVTGYKVSTGLSRCVIDELPTRPLLSLTELQNWDARFENPIPPYSFNLIGNSDATPLIAPGGVVNSAEVSAKGAQNLQHDDSYCLNHMLFDDWFCSSIAATPTEFGRPPGSSNARRIYADFLREGGDTLKNRAYHALPEDVAAAATGNADTLASKYVGTTSTAWKTIASRLEVEGMFNVNSTSVIAWRALLGHARNQRVPYMDGNGSPKLSSETDYPFSRFTVAGDVATNGNGSSGEIAGAAEYSGYRVFEGKDLDFLAEEIVNQVRQRGPFLSLSEFVNRQLSSGDLALAGAVQTALNKLAEGSSNPYSVLETNRSDAGSNLATGNPPGGVSGYKFPAAAANLGYNIYGIPGWTRQADLLRAIAPVLSARDDTFTIRGYGEAKDRAGKNVLATAVCEATVRRTRDYVDPADDAATASISASGGRVRDLAAASARFGRKFDVVSFRWLAPGEI